MRNQILPLSEKLITIRTNPGSTDELNKALVLMLGDLNEFTIEHFELDGVKSALIHNSKKGTKKFKIILNGHLDVIPGKDHQYIPKVEGNRLYGVGAMDMKSNLVSLMLAFKAVAKKVNYPLALQLVTDEEVGGFKGTKYQIEQGIRADFVISSEPTNLNIVNQAKGILWLKISTKGKSAHGAYPWKGKNAIWKMHQFLNQLEKNFPIPDKQAWITTVNLSSTETSNHIFNKVPDNCSISLDIRFIPEDSKIILNKIKSMLPKGFKLEILANESALLVEQNNQYLKLLQKTAKMISKQRVRLYAAQGSSDARHFTKVGCAGVEFGPIGGGIGADEEWVDIPSLEKYYQIIKQFLLSL